MTIFDDIGDSFSGDGVIGHEFTSGGALATAFGSDGIIGKQFALGGPILSTFEGIGNKIIKLYNGSTDLLGNLADLVDFLLKYGIYIIVGGMILKVIEVAKE